MRPRVYTHGLNPDGCLVRIGLYIRKLKNRNNRCEGEVEHASCGLDLLSKKIDIFFKGRGVFFLDKPFNGCPHFSPRFCNPASGHEKGGVEGMVGYVRRNYLVPLPRVESLEELNEYLLGQCLADGDHRVEGKEGCVDELFEQEKSHLISLPCSPYSNIMIGDGKVNHYSTVLVDKNHYSVPICYAGLKTKINISIDEVEIFRDGKRIARHKRLFANNKWQIEPQHYLELIKQRSGSFDTARPIQQWRVSWPKALESLLARFQTSQGEYHKG